MTKLELLTFIVFTIGMKGKNSLDSLYNSRYGLNEDYGDMEGASAGALQLDSNGAVVPKRYFGRFNNIIRWG